ncbi:AraC family transcriptional regulator [Tepidamorphus gemmatus]|jgi:AraC-like DNA-binding protein|uniref:AraC family transcriptional regulator n=1 Tax=Tepidamorphus gemmatus TaxID=747076 RepID=A0A4R3MJ22_9HYPH|nr:helix-turn-helix transcriptional regulator [Tepidamorphus gemmatus]TCT13632.1 AraC family transcriptional regulator [Tepidamorphus gemmatus]
MSMSAADVTVPIDTLSVNHRAGHRIHLHAHDQAQLIFGRSGVMRVTAANGLWVVPPARALWVPGRTPHAIQCRTAVEMRTVYLPRGIDMPFAGRCAVIEVSPLLREVVLRLVEGPVTETARGHLVALLLGELRARAEVPLSLAEPRDARLRRVTEALAADPADGRSLDDWAEVASMARRTFARRFLAETGLSFGAWRRRLRMLGAIERLAAGEAVTTVALDAGYDSLSAFIHAFRRTMGVTPGAYFAD